MNTSLLKSILPYCVTGVIGGVIGLIVGQLVAQEMEKRERERLQPELPYSGVDMPEGPSHTVITVDGVEMTQEEFEAWKTGMSKIEKEWKNADAQPVLPKKPSVKVKGGIKVDYSAISKKQDDKPQLTDLAKERLGEQAVDPNKPYIINLDDYALPSSQDRVTLTYYEKDDTLCGEDQEIITGRDSLIGSETLTKFGVESDDPDSVYVRNEKNGTDYEIVRLHKRYSVDVMGMPDPDVVVEKKNSRRANTRKVTNKNGDNDKPGDE